MLAFPVLIHGWKFLFLAGRDGKLEIAFQDFGKGREMEFSNGKGREIWGWYSRELRETGIPAHPWMMMMMVNIIIIIIIIIIYYHYHCTYDDSKWQVESYSGSWECSEAVKVSKRVTRDLHHWRYLRQNGACHNWKNNGALCQIDCLFSQHALIL